MAFIKSHSNYVLKKNHQTISDGTIWERDITTIGGVNQFSRGQVPIYKSSNFIITVRNDGKTSNQYNQIKWKENETSDVWTLETLSGMTSDSEDQNDIKIVLKKDYYDFRDFAYYGSLSEMFRASINDVLTRFPGEMYGTSENAYYTSASTVDFERIEERLLFGEPRYDNDGSCTPMEVSNNQCVVCSCNGDCEESETCQENAIVVDSGATYIDNPYGINVHSVKKPTDGNVLKFFAEKGYKNYEIIDGDNESGTEITSWETRNFIKVIKHEVILDMLYGDDAFYYDYLKPEILKDYFSQPNNEVWWSEGNNEEAKEKSRYKGSEYEGSSGYTLLERNFQYGEIHDKIIEYSNKYWIEEIVTSQDCCKCKTIKVYEKFFDTRKEAQDRANELNVSADTATTYAVGHGVRCGNIGCYISTPCKGYKAASTTLNGSVIIDTWVGDNDELVYLSDSGKTSLNKHIRPIEEFRSQFYNDCDSLEKILLNRDSKPLYKATFSIIKENEKGYYRETEDFIFPTTYGGYNLDASSSSFNDYAKRLAKIGEYYDSIFTDNLYRSMTHESIKNFDWSYTREFNQGDEEEYVHGGEKIQKALRVFAREFDEILSYINNIKNINKVSYDERNNIPDYFLIDEVEKKGWDTCLVYPYNLEEYYKNDDGSKTYISSDSYNEQQQLDNKDGDNFFTRQFTQNAKNEIIPYASKLLKYKKGYFITCDGDVPCHYEGGEMHYGYTEAESGNTYYDSDKEKILNRIKSFADDATYTYMDANNEFMRRLAINSNYILRHKGTVEGIEMILAMFGLKSKRWVERIPEYRQECEKNKNDSSKEYDYEITEYSSFTNRIEEKWDAVHQMYRIDWINSTKAIVYDYRSTSNYTQYGSQSDYVSYQGLPISYRYEYLDSDEPFIKVSPLKYDTEQESTSKVEEAFKRIDENNAPVLRRYLYPNFDKNEQLDGNPYFQMNGGWLAKTVSNGGKTYNFQYDADDSIAYTEVNKDNLPLFKETIRNIKRVDTINDLLATPIDTLLDGSVFYVSKVNNNIAVLDNEAYEIKYEYDDGKILRYVSLKKNNEYIKVGDSKFFSSIITVYDNKGNEKQYNLLDKESGYEVKAYIKDDNSFICQANTDGAYTIDSFTILDEDDSNAFTNYFIIDDAYYSDRIANSDGNNGWRRLKNTDQEYIRINTITNYYKGNNPHNGNMVYDNGYEYFTYFKKLFKYTVDNDLFDERCYEAFYYDLDNEIIKYGFKNLVDEDESIKDYSSYMLNDNKIHYFGNYYKKGDSNPTECKDILCYGESKSKIDEMTKMYQEINKKINVNNYILDDDANMIGGSPYSGQSDVDEVTNQILNNKRMTIKFRLHNEWHTNRGQCEVKYLDTIVMNYLTQMIPSTAIVDIQYIYEE